MHLDALSGAAQSATATQRAEIERLVGALLIANQAASAARTPHEKTLNHRNAAALRSQVEQIVSVLFELSDADLALAKSIDVPA
ncbi:hypothetical protein GC169_12410 [bacterium]|nr:hypothetical protein [bacterium]